MKNLKYFFVATLVVTLAGAGIARTAGNDRDLSDEVMKGLIGGDGHGWCNDSPVWCNRSETPCPSHLVPSRCAGDKVGDFCGDATLDLFPEVCNTSFGNQNCQGTYMEVRCRERFNCLCEYDGQMNLVCTNKVHKDFEFQFLTTSIECENVVPAIGSD